MAFLGSRDRMATMGAAALLVLAPALPLAGAAAEPLPAQRIPISSYDIVDTPTSGWGGWNHTYNGTISPTGGTVSGSAIGPLWPLANYTGGSGTLNDGVISNVDNHLFTTRTADDGQPIRPAITLRLPGQFTIESILLHGGTAGVFPGMIDAGTITVGTTSVQIASTPVGSPGFTPDDLFTLPASAAAVPTTTITVSDVTSNLYGWPIDQFCITEITVMGRPAEAATEVGIAVKPGDDQATVQAEASGLVPVAILSTPDFDAVTAVAPTSVTFGKTGLETSVVKWRTDDVNRDRLDDLVVFAATTLTGLVAGDSVANLRGQMLDGTTLTGSDSVNVVGHP